MRLTSFHLLRTICFLVSVNWCLYVSCLFVYRVVLFYFLEFLLLLRLLGFPGGAVVESLPANAGDTGSSPGLGGSRMPRSGWAREPQLLSLRVWSLCSATREARASRWRVAPACRNWRKPSHRNEDATQPKSINQSINQSNIRIWFKILIKKKNKKKK